MDGAGGLPTRLKSQIRRPLSPDAPPTLSIFTGRTSEMTHAGWCTVFSTCLHAEASMAKNSPKVPKIGYPCIQPEKCSFPLLGARKPALRGTFSSLVGCWGANCLNSRF